VGFDKNDEHTLGRAQNELRNTGNNKQGKDIACNVTAMTEK